MSLAGDASLTLLSSNLPQDLGSPLIDIMGFMMTEE
jgi:hypothetical protein